MNRRAFLTATAAALMVLAVNPARAAVNVLQDTIMIRVGGQDYGVRFAVPPGKMVYFANGENCGAGHKTTQNRFYAHLHISYTLPQTGTDVSDGTPRQVTAAGIKAFWDNQYSPGYTSSGNENVASNCHGYALAKSTWIQDPGYIDADELQAATDWSDTKILRGGTAHSIKVDKYRPGVWYGSTIDTSEKNGPSRIYSTSWGYFGPNNATAKKKWK